jgi:4-amino-4-deoxy-L-arabinose transferase-like glycosyltransferase
MSIETSMSTQQQTTGTRLATYLLMAAAVIMSIFQYLYCRSFWTDEAAVVVNIMDRDFAGLMKPLMYYQMAPILYLWITKAITTVFTPNEYSFRILSLIAYLTSLWLVWKLLTRFVKDGLAVFIGLAFFVFNNKLFYYSSELKQYMTDTMVTLILLYVATDPLSANRRKMLVMSLVGALAIFLSNVVVTVLPMIFLFIFFSESKPWQWSHLRSMLLMGFMWLLAFVINYFMFMHDHPSRAQQLIFFAEAFPPTNLLSKQALAFFEYKLQVVKRDFGFGQNNTHPTISIQEYVHYAIFLLLLAGYVWNVTRRANRILLLIVIPILMHAVLAYFKAYPLAIRNMLYQYPLICIILALGAEKWLSLTSRIRPVLTAVTFILTAVLCVIFVRVQLPHQVEESKPVLSFMQEHSRGEETIYSYSAGNYTLDAYIRTKYYKPTGPVIWGTYFKGDHVQAAAEIGSLHPKSAWIFFAHFADGLEHRIMGELSNSGYRQTDSVRAKGAAAYRIEAAAVK